MSQNRADMQPLAPPPAVSIGGARYHCSAIPIGRNREPASRTAGLLGNDSRNPRVGDIAVPAGGGMGG